MSDNEQQYIGLAVENYKTGISSFIFHWMMHNTRTMKIPPGQAHEEPLAWVRQLCDDIEQKNVAEHTTTQ